MAALTIPTNTPAVTPTKKRTLKSRKAVTPPPAYLELSEHSDAGPFAAAGKRKRATTASSSKLQPKTSGEPVVTENFVEMARIARLHRINPPSEREREAQTKKRAEEVARKRAAKLPMVSLDGLELVDDWLRSVRTLFHYLQAITEELIVYLHSPVAAPMRTVRGQWKGVPHKPSHGRIMQPMHASTEGMQLCGFRDQEAGHDRMVAS